MDNDIVKSTAIIGAGIGGLSLAAYLQRHDYKETIDIYERSPILSSRGGTIRIDAPTQRALAGIGVLDIVEETGIRNKRFDTYSNGRLLGQWEYNLSSDFHLISISREALQKILADAVDNSSLHLDYELSEISEDNLVSTRFVNGEKGQFDLVVGADGIHSTVNDILFPQSDSAVFSGLVVYYCIAKGTYLPEPVHTEHFISRGAMGFRQVTVAGGGSDGRWDSLQITTRGGACSSEWASSGTIDEVKEYLAMAGENCLPGAIDILENADRVFKWGMFQSPQKTSWISSGGKVVLLGDAAHAMAPFTGQGACSAIQDSICLGKLLLEKDTTDSVLKQYETSRKKVCEESILNAYTRGMHITAHGISRWSIDLLTRGMYFAMRYKHGRRLSLALGKLLRQVAQISEKIDAILDKFRLSHDR